MITASHNPVGNNGIKLSADYGGQLLPEDGQAISDNYPEVNLSTVKTMDYDRAVVHAGGIIGKLGVDEDEEYIKSVIDLSQDSRLTSWDRDTIGIIFDGLYGTARGFTPNVLTEIGYDVTEVEEHAVFDPNFTGLTVPNPTDPAALKLAREYADRAIGRKGSWRQLTGNETWTLITEYLLSRMKESGESLEGKTIVKSWVTTGLITRIAERFGVNVIETPVGFKWIGALGANDPSIIAGFEESNGATLLTHSREKDGVLTAALFAEAVAYWNEQLNPGGETAVIMSNDADGDRLVVEVLEDSVVIQQLENIRREYGEINNVVDNTTFEGPEGISQRDKIVSGLASNPPVMLGAFKVSGIQTEIREVKDGVRIALEDGSTITLRKSGTEPILRIYVETEGNPADIIAAIKNYIAGQLK
ncbi:MAG: hypothetical protein NTZ48_05730, partial [Candidatus Omnitrophica bacterium]|nr:hypothetical protein [Candidatus Omnitrophota bacterium]